jgi:soluble lytic murein transglycosylase-like protein
MRFCLKALVGLGVAGCLPAASVEISPHRVTSVVRADPRTGRLVRNAVVPAKPVTPRLVPQQAVSAQTSKPARAVDEIIERAAQEHEVDPLLVHSIIKVESNYNQYAISHKGAEGLMQLMPSTARGLGVRNSFDAEQNILAGVKHFKYLQERFKDLRLALAAYNAGEGAVEKYDWIPPYPETQNYVYQVGKKYGEARRAGSQKIAASKPLEPEKREYAPVEYYVDAEGKLYLRTK